jgi:hypothetical protein
MLLDNRHSQIELRNSIVPVVQRIERRFPSALTSRRSAHQPLPGSTFVAAWNPPTG